MKVRVSDVSSLDYVPTLDGEPIPNCLEADDVEGYAIVYVLSDGLPLMRNGDLVTERIEGDITLVPRTDTDSTR